MYALVFLKSLFEILDADSSGYVDQRELLAGLALVLGPSLSDEKRLELVFAAYDMDGNGTLSFEELQELICAYRLGNAIRHHPTHNVDAFGKLFTYLDANKDGQISCSEFLYGVKNHPVLSSLLLIRL